MSTLYTIMKKKFINKMGDILSHFCGGQAWHQWTRGVMAKVCQLTHNIPRNTMEVRFNVHRSKLTMENSKSHVETFMRQLSYVHWRRRRMKVKSALLMASMPRHRLPSHSPDWTIFCCVSVWVFLWRGKRRCAHFVFFHSHAGCLNGIAYTRPVYLLVW